MLDPTAGSGAALRAAEALGARRVLGLEIDREMAVIAAQELHNSRLMRDL
jgi:predicted RNA methylase